MANVVLELRRHVQVGGAGLFLEHVLARDGNGFHSLVDGGRSGRHHLGRTTGFAHHVADGARDGIGLRVGLYLKQGVVGIGDIAHARL